MPTKTIIDKRENSLIALYISDSTPHETRQLDLGDILIQYSKTEFNTSSENSAAANKLLGISSSSTSSSDNPEIHSILIERKSFKDLKSSMSDGRYHEQKSRYTQLPHGCVYYIFENNDPRFEELGWKQYIGAYVNTMIRDDIPVFITSSLEETYKLLIKITQSLEEFGVNPKTLSVPKETTQIKKKKLSGKDVYKQQLCCFSGISSSKADAIAFVYPNITSLIDAIKDDSFKVKGVGPKLIEKIKDGLCLNE